MQMLKLHKQLSGQKQPREKSSDFGLMNSDSRQLLAYKQEELLAAQKQINELHAKNMQQAELLM